MPYPNQQRESSSYSRVNPNFYIHQAILNVSTSLSSGVASGKKEDGFILLILHVDQLETICRARGILMKGDLDYKNSVDQFKRENNYQSNDLYSNAFIANYKWGLLMEKIFSALPTSTIHRLDMKKLGAGSVTQAELVDDTVR